MSDQVAYMVTRKVKHLAAWTQGREQASDYWTQGEYRPICGASLTHDRHGQQVKRHVWPNFPYEDPAVLAEADRRPLCKACRKTAEALAGLVITS